jgi:hypothetical protein
MVPTVGTIITDFAIFQHTRGELLLTAPMLPSIALILQSKLSACAVREQLRQRPALLHNSDRHFHTLSRIIPLIPCQVDDLVGNTDPLCHFSKHGVLAVQKS